jgi:hypothetical protein
MYRLFVGAVYISAIVNAMLSNEIVVFIDNEEVAWSLQNYTASNVVTVLPFCSS